MSRTKTFPLLLAAFAVMAIVLSCTDEPTAPPMPGSGDTLAVTVVDVAPTFLTLQLHVNSAGEYRLDRDGQTAWSGSITPPDTVITDTGLLPSTEYHYTLSHIIDGGVVSSSPMTTARTGDTVSHEFVWEVDTLFWPGTSNPAFFTANTMYAISATNVYMGGYTTGNKETCWHWDGEEWTVINLGPTISGEVIDIDGIDSTFIVFAGRGDGTVRYTSMMALDNGTLGMLPLPLGEKNRTCVHVAARNEIYLGSVQGIQRYNGVEWEWMLDSTETTGNEFKPLYIYKFPDGTLEMVSQKNANALSNIVQWKWADEQFVVVDSFPTEVPGYAGNTFGYTIHESGSGVFSTGLNKTFMRTGAVWEQIHDIGGVFLSGTLNNLIIGWRWTGCWHYNGSTIKNLWSEISSLVPRIEMINAITFIDGVLFVCAEYDQSSRDVVVLRGRQVKK